MNATDKDSRHPLLECTGAYFVGGQAVACDLPECVQQRIRWEAEAARHHLPRLGLARYANLILRGAIEERPVTTVARAWAGLRDRPFLVLLGPVGSGKTVAAILALSAATFDLAYLSASRLHSLRPADLELYATKRALLLDDLGLENLSNAAAALHLFDLVNTRYLGERRTIITSNLTRSAIRARYDDRILRRLAEAGFWFDGYAASPD